MICLMTSDTLTVIVFRDTTQVWIGWCEGGLGMGWGGGVQRIKEARTRRKRHL